MVRKKIRLAGSRHTEQENNRCDVEETDKDNKLLHCCAKLFCSLSKLLKSCCHIAFSIVQVVEIGALKLYILQISVLGLMIIT